MSRIPEMREKQQPSLLTRGGLAYRAKKNYDASAWSSADDGEVRQIVQPTLRLLTDAFPKTLLAMEWSAAQAFSNSAPV